MTRSAYGRSPIGLWQSYHFLSSIFVYIFQCKLVPRLERPIIPCRSLEINRQGFQEDSADNSLIIILKWLAAEGYLKNNHLLVVKIPCSRSSPLFEVICSMRNLQTLGLFDSELTLEDLACVFLSCSDITFLNISEHTCTMFKKFEHIKNQLRPGFQRLQYFALASPINNIVWPVIQETLT